MIWYIVSVLFVLLGCDSSRAGSLENFRSIKFNDPVLPKLPESLLSNAKAYQSPGDCRGRAIIITLQTDTNRHGPIKKCAGDETKYARNQTRIIVYSIDPKTKKTMTLFDDLVNEVHALIWDSEAVSVCPDILITMFDPFFRQGKPDEILRLRYKGNLYEKVIP